jgi:RND superfamily putative drug exporter
VVKRLADFISLYGGRVLAVVLVAAVAAGALGASIFDVVRPYSFEDPDSESARAYDRIENATGEMATQSVLLLVPIADPSRPAAGPSVRAAAAELRRIPGVSSVALPVAGGGLVSSDGTQAIVAGTLRASVDDPADVGEAVEERLGDRGEVLAGGSAVAAHQINETTEEDLRRIELLAAPFLLLISFLVFRSVTAALLPILIGTLSLAFTLAALRLLAEPIDLDVFALNVTTVLGFGLAIDYSLFMVSRYREELGKSPPREALAATLSASGRMICFSALIVAAAVASLAIFPQRFLYSIGIGGALVALISAAVVLIVLPATLALLGHRVTGGTPDPASGRGVPRRRRALAGFVIRHPVAVALLTSALLLAAGIPFLRAELTRADASVLPADASARAVDTALKERFESDPTSTLLVVVPAGDPVVVPSVQLAGLDGVTAVSPPHRLDGVSVIRARTGGDPYTDESLDRIEAARELNWRTRAEVTGASAELVDQRESLKEHLPYAVAIVLATTVLVLFAMTGSVLLPLQAVAMNALTLAAAFGILVLLFQDGRGEDLLGFSSVDAIDTSVPILLFAVIFGLSTDYGVFLLTRVAEARRQGASDSEAIVIGLERTGLVITGAALLFAVAMGAFAFSQMIFIKEVAVGTALSVLIDATIVRAFLFPALMRLGGRWTWWGPRWARRGGPAWLRP